MLNNREQANYHHNGTKKQLMKYGGFIGFALLGFFGRPLLNTGKNTYETYQTGKNVQKQLETILKDTTFYYPKLEVITKVERKTLEGANLHAGDNGAKIHLTEFKHIVLDSIQIKGTQTPDGKIHAIIISQPSVTMYSSFADPATYYNNTGFTSGEPVITDLIEILNKLGVEGKPIKLPINTEQQQLIHKQIGKYGVNIVFED